LSTWIWAGLLSHGSSSRNAATVCAFPSLPWIVTHLITGKYDIRYLDEPGDEDGDIVIRIEQGTQKKNQSIKCSAPKEISSRLSKNLLAAGVTLFAA
jgi:hypothetical protein